VEPNARGEDRKPKIVIITGPTATGKSALALKLARRFGGQIVNADSMQVYRGMNIGTAKPTPEEREGIPHHLYDIVDPDEVFNAASYRKSALPLLKDLSSAGVLPFLVGGTGLYIKVLLGGLLECPAGDPAYRESLLREVELKGAPFLHDRLRRLDPEAAARIHPNDRVRVTRALEIINSTGRPLSALIRAHRFSDKPFNALKICLQMDREHLYHRIDLRCESMLENGLIEETKDLLEKGYSPEIKPMKSIGYRHVVQYLQGRWTLRETLSSFQRDTRRYAKRQLTWFRSDSEMVWMAARDPEPIIRKIEAFL